MIDSKPDFQACRLLDMNSAGQYVGLSYWTIRAMIFRGEIPFIRAGRRILVDIRDLDAWVEANKIQEEAL